MPQHNLPLELSRHLCYDVFMRIRVLKYSIALFVALLSSCHTQRNAAETQTEQKIAQERPLQKMPTEEAQFSPNVLIIMYDVAIGKAPLQDAIREYGAEIIYDYNIIPGCAVKIPDATKMGEAIAYFEKVHGVISVQRDAIIHLDDAAEPQ